MKLETKINLLIRLLKNVGVRFEKGLSQSELETIESSFNFNFPPDLSLLLQTELPVTNTFIDWRLCLNSPIYKKEVTDRINRVIEGFFFDIQYNKFWMKDWGEKPNSLDRQKQIVKDKFNNYPKLIPVYSHRFIPSLPNEEGNPVFSVHQTDIIYYGYDLATYFVNEFKIILPQYFEVQKEPRHIDFWCYFVEE